MSRLLSRERVRDAMLGLALLCATLALMLYPQPAMEAARSGLRLCYNVILPTLFPASPSSTTREDRTKKGNREGMITL